MIKLTEHHHWQWAYAQFELRKSIEMHICTYDQINRTNIIGNELWKSTEVHKG